MPQKVTEVNNMELSFAIEPVPVKAELKLFKQCFVPKKKQTFPIFQNIFTIGHSNYGGDMLTLISAWQPLPLSLPSQ